MKIRLSSARRLAPPAVWLGLGAVSLALAACADAGDPTGGTDEAATACAATSGVQEVTVEKAGSSYEVRVFVPTAVGDTALLPAVVVFHAGGMTADQLVEADEFEELAEAEGFVVVHPEADRDWPFWEIEDDDNAHRDDLAFAVGLLDRLQDDWCADPSRTYAAGLSIGGTFAARLACDLPGRIAAVGVVAQHGVAEELCVAPDPTPIVQFNGTTDPIIPFRGDGEPDPSRPEPASWAWMIQTDIPDAFAAGAVERGCGAEPSVSGIAEDVTEYRYDGCDGDVELVRYEIDGGGHAWPGDSTAPREGPFGFVTDTISTTDILWDFFRSHPG